MVSSWELREPGLGLYGCNLSISSITRVSVIPFIFRSYLESMSAGAGRSFKIEIGIRRTGAGVVWLQPLDKLNNPSVSDSLYFSFVLGEHVRRRWPFFQDRKLNLRNVLPPVVGIRKMPDDMVEARSEMVDNFAGEHAKQIGRAHV